MAKATDVKINITADLDLCVVRCVTLDCRWNRRDYGEAVCNHKQLEIVDGKCAHYVKREDRKGD